MRLLRKAPFTLTNPYFLAGKAGAACALALVAVQLLEIPDLVTASFVAVLCCSPGALMGVRTSLEQLAGSALGGVFGTLAATLGLPIEVGVPVAVSLAILTTHAVGMASGTVAAAFTALFLQIVAFGDPVQTFAYRLQAVGIAGGSALVVNLLVSSFFYRALFSRRLSKLRAHFDDLLRESAQAGPEVMHEIFGSITELRTQLEQAIRELEWRRRGGLASELRSMHAELLWLRRFAHLIVDLGTADGWAEPGRKAFLVELANRRLPPAEGQTEAMQRICRHLQACPGAKQL